MLSANINHIRKFILFAAKELDLSSLPQIKLVGSSENRFSAFGHSIGSVIVCRITERHPIDIMRTLAHELIHYKQNILKRSIKMNSREDQANVLAGRIMRKFDIAHPEVFRDKAIRANMFNEEALGPVAVNSMGSSGSSGDGAIGTYDPLLQFKNKKRKRTKSLRQILKP